MPGHSKVIRFFGFDFSSDNDQPLKQPKPKTDEHVRGMLRVYGLNRFLEEIFILQRCADANDMSLHEEALNPEYKALINQFVAKLNEILPPSSD